MTISNLPSTVQQVIQNGWLMRFFNDALFPQLLYRNMYAPVEVPQHLGESYSFSKKGLLPIVQSALTPPANTDNTSGLTSVSVGVEQYSGVLAQYAAMTATNMLSSGIAIVDLYKSAVEDLGLNAGQSLDVQGRRAMFQAYAGGRTYVTTAAGPTTSVAVADVNGFDFVYVNGVRQTTSVTNPLSITITESGVAATRNVTGVTPGSLNVNDDKIPGTLTLSANVTVIVGDSAIASTAPYSVRPNGKTTSYNLVANDILNFATLNAATTQLRRMGIPAFEDGFYKAIIDPQQTNELLQDSAVQRIYDTHADSEEFQRGAVAIGAGAKLYESIQTPSSANPAGVLVRRGLVMGKETGYEVRSSLIANWLDSNSISATGSVVFSPEAYVAMILRTPQDALQQVVTNSWSFIGAWVMATDSLSTLGGSSAIYKRAVMLESA